MSLLKPCTQEPATPLVCPLQVEAFLFGSVPLRAVLPDGDIDISVFTMAAAGGAAGGSSAGGGGASGDGSVQGQPPGELRNTWASQLLRALEREASRQDAPFKIRDVQIIQAEVGAGPGCLLCVAILLRSCMCGPECLALLLLVSRTSVVLFVPCVHSETAPVSASLDMWGRHWPTSAVRCAPPLPAPIAHAPPSRQVKLVKCVVSDVVVDVSFDTVGGLCTLAFLEAADRRIGRQHLFKRAILLVRVSGCSTCQHACLKGSCRAVPAACRVMACGWELVGQAVLPLCQAENV